MTDTFDFLDIQWSDVQEPKPLPEGEYVFSVKSYRPDKIRNDKQTPYIRLYLRPVEVVDAVGVEQSDLPNAKAVEHDLWMSKDAAANTKRVLRDIFHANMETDAKTSLEGILGTQVRAVIYHKKEGPDKDLLVPRVKKFLPLS